MVSTNALIVSARFALVTMSISAAFYAATLSTDRHGSGAVLVALTAWSRALLQAVSATRTAPDPCRSVLKVAA